MAGTTIVESLISIPSTHNFPVTWPHPDDATRFWSLDRMHWPAPITPMTGQYIDYMFLDGFNRALQAYELPIREDNRRFNTYHYYTIVPCTLSDVEMAAQNQRAEQNLVQAIQHLAENWNDQYLPEIKQHLAYWENFTLGVATLPALLAHLDETIARVKRVYEIHFLVYFPFVLAPSLFEELYRDLFGNEHVLETYRLLQGIDNKTLEGDRVLWQLSRQARATPAVLQILQQQPAAQVVTALETAVASGGFLAELGSYLTEYGQRNEKSNELDAPHWIENPTPVIQRLQEYITQADRDPAADLASQAAARERLLAETHTRLQAYPQPVVDQFNFLLKAARAGVFVGEEHSYWIDQRVTCQVRRVMLEFGRRLAATGVLDQADDVFYLTFDEVRTTTEAVPRLDQRHIVAGRRAEMVYFRTVQPPSTLGAPPPGPPPDDPLSRAIGRFFGAPPPPLTETNMLSGNAGSPGVARGPARVVRSLAEGGKLQSGEVLVVETAMPAWTPLFAIAAAVVTDTGGVLCHAAVVAREYGIPAVVGTGLATRTLHDGQLVEVDGGAGVVHIIV